MFLFRITFTSKQPANSFLGSLYTNQICKSYLKALDKPQTAFYSLKKESESPVNKVYKINNDGYNKINRHEQQNMNSHEEALNLNMKKLYSAPVNNLRNIYNIVESEFNEKCLSVSYSILKQEESKAKIQCTIDVKWPSNMSFSFKGQNKKIAQHNAAKTCLKWLCENKKLMNLKPIMYDLEDIEHKLKVQRSVEINLESEFKNAIQTLMHTFKEVIEPIIKEQPMTDFEADSLTKKKFKPTANSPFFQARNDRLARRLQNRANAVHDLPVYNYRQKILNILEHNQILLIKGSTGCGKSTQVPQFIMDEYTKQYRGSECNIIVMQPRRVGAISLARRIASERNEDIGDVIGYHVRFESVKPKAPGSIIFSTSGILLRMLESNPTLEGVSHVIVDEAHERSLEIDILLKLMKEILQINQSLKLIIMSATINEGIFQRYFSCEVIDIPGKLYPVTTHFKEDIPIFKWPSKQDNLMKLEIPFDKIVKLVQWIFANKPPGSILCFLPGWQEIKQLYNLLEKSNISNLLLLPLHSKVPNHVQLKVFNRVSENVRKVILATDIAECSITIEDIRYVIDTAIKKEYEWDKDGSVPVLNYNLISRANIHQRRGRAGRVKPGESYHLITREEYNILNLYPKPEILRVPLDNAVMISKKLSNEKIQDFFDSMLDPPDSKLVSHTVEKLKTLGILDEDENFTDLGKRASYFSLNPELSRALVLSCVFQCLKPILLLVSIPLNEGSTVSVDEKNDKSIVRLQKVQFHGTSDHIAMLRYYDYYTEPDNKPDIGHWPSYFKTIDQHYKLHATELVDSGMFHSIKENEDKNMFNQNNELIRAVLFAASNHLIKRDAYGYKSMHFTRHADKLITENTDRIILHTHSVNYKRKNWPSDMMTYLHKRKLPKFYTTSETSMLTPLSVLLFSHNDVQCYKQKEDIPTEKEKVYIKINNINNVEFCCDEETANLLLQFRSMIWDVANYVIKYEGVKTRENDLKEIKSYKTKVLIILASMLSKLAKNIDSDIKY